MPGSKEIDPERLPTQLEANPDFELVRSAAAGMPVYVVGGVVRDLLIGEPRSDLDLVVEGDIAPLADALGGEITEHERFRTATVALERGDVDIAQARAETYPHPGALPVVSPATITDDLARRDFTINAMAFPLSGNGELIDPHGGVDDLRAGLLRILHEGSFLDDPTRALRAARYVARLGLEPEPETTRLLGEADLSTVSEDRVVAELARIAAEDRPAVPLELLTSWGVLDLGVAARLAAELERLFEGNPEWRSFADPETSILLAAAPGDHPAQLRRRAAKLAKHDPPGSPAQIQVLAHGHVPEVLAIARAAGASWLDDYVARLRHVELEISGEDLIEAGVPEGPAVGRGLNAALSAKLDGEISGHEDELRVALAAAEESA
jgi:tRNA nucleotidyltransferase (CCA-adding enzyme)